jgi:acetylornithine deacetylase/succinyl-diaminopimelate desuccinylase-like protein
MRAPDGRIAVEGIASEPSPAERELAREAFDTAAMLALPRIPEAESGSSYGEAMLHPALNVTQLSFGGTGPQRNAIDPEATAGFDLRLTAGLTPAQCRAAIERHRRLARIEWDDSGYPAASAPLDDPGVGRVIDVMRRATAGAVRVVPLMGGSLPIAPVGEVLGVPFVILPIVNADNNQHAPNENLRLREFRKGIEFYAALLAEAGTGWD